MISVAIDGPAGAGKSTVAKILANKLGFVYFDTGALYRAMGYYFVAHGIDYRTPKLLIENLGKINIKFEKGVIFYESKEEKNIWQDWQTYPDDRFPSGSAHPPVCDSLCRAAHGNL